MTGIVRFTRTIPSIADPVGWARLFRQLNDVLTQDSSNYIFNANTTLSNRAGVAVSTVLQRIGDAGRATDQRLLPLVNASNKLSTQSVQPLTASESGGVATISIAAHSVQFGFGTVAYSSGSITGLNTSTAYYVYADDPGYEGGAVTYLSTTNANIVTAGNGRYYVGRITTPAGGGGGTSGGWGSGGGGGGSQIP